MPRQSLKQRTDGRYACKYKGKFFYGQTQSEALAAREAYKRQEEKGLRKSYADMTFLEYSSLWIKVYKTDVTQKTHNQIACCLEAAGEHLGTLKMMDITATDVKAAFNAKIGMSKSYLKKYTQAISGVFRAAVNDGAVLKNPCDGLKRPTGTEGTHRALEKWERKLIVQTAGEHPIGPLAMLMLYAGLRRGEAVALDIDRDVDFDAGCLHVREAVSFSEGNRPVIKAPKTNAGVRTIPLFPPLRAALEGRHGTVVDLKKISSASNIARIWRTYLTFLKKKSGRDDLFIRTHDLRHTFCTMLYDADVDIKTAQKWMGHANEQMILRIYAHLSHEKESSAALAMAKLTLDDLK